MKHNDLINKYYSNKVFNKVYYTGLSKFINDFGHKLLEKGLSSKFGFREVLEIGATHGQHIKFIQHSYRSYTLLDINKPENIDDLIKGYPSIKFIKADAENVSETNLGKYDRILATCILHHLSQPLKSLKSWIDLLNDGGRVDLLIPCEPTFLWKIGRKVIIGPKLKKEGINKDDYAQIVLDEHIQEFKNIKKQLDTLKLSFKIKYTYWPFPFLPWFLNIYAKFTLFKT